MRYARRDLRSEYGVLKNCSGNYKWTISRKLYLTLSVEDKRKYAEVE